MNRLVILLFLISPFVGISQTQYKQSIGINVISLGLGVQYERWISDAHSLSLMYGRDLQFKTEGSLHQGNVFRLQYRLHISGLESNPNLGGGVIFSSFIEHADKRLLRRDFNRATYEQAAIGAMLGYRLIVGKNKRIVYEVLLGPKYQIPYVKIPEWYSQTGGNYQMNGFSLGGTIGILFLLDPKNS